MLLAIRGMLCLAGNTNASVVCEIKFTYLLTYYQLRQLRRFVQSITAEAARTVAAYGVYILSLDFCNLLLYGLTDTPLRKSSCSLCRTPQHDWSLARDVTITSRQYYMNSIGYPSESVSSSKLHCLVRQSLSGQAPLSTWQMIAASCPTALGALCGQLTFRTSLVQRTLSSYGDSNCCSRLDLARGTLFRSSCTIQTSPTECLDDSWRDTLFSKHERGALWLLIWGAIEKHLLTFLLVEVGYQKSTEEKHKTSRPLFGVTDRKNVFAWTTVCSSSSLVY